jgi:DNA-binding XRE family transcriptional regulator
MEQQVSALPPPHASFGSLLRAWRRRANLSQEQLAARAGVSERTMRDLEAGRVRSPRTDTGCGRTRCSWPGRSGRADLRPPGGRITSGRGPGRAGRQGCPAKAPPSRRWVGAAPAGEQHPVPPLAHCGFTAKTVAPGRREDRPTGQVAHDADPTDPPVRARAGLDRRDRQ